MNRRSTRPEAEHPSGSTSIHHDLRLSRRGLLKALGGAAIGASVLGRGIRPAFAAGGPPRRLVVFFTPHGAPAEFFWPTSIADLSASQSTVSVLTPLQKYASKLNVIRGLDYVGSNNHPAIHDAITNRTGTSIDTSIAKALGVKPLRLGVVPDYPQSFTTDGQFAFDNGVPQPHAPDPAAVFDALAANLPASSGGGGGQTPNPGPGPLDYRKLALGVTSAELDALKSRIGSSTKLDKHLAAVRAAAATASSGGGASPVITCTEKPVLPSVDKVRGKNVWAAENFADVLAAQIDVASFALRCGLTRVVSIQCGYVNNQIPFTWLGIGDGHHNLSHNSVGAPGRALHAKCQQWYASQLATLMDNLSVDDPEDRGKKMIDNTIILWCSEIADGQLHNCESVPTVLMGNAGNYFKTGQIVNLQSRSHAELLLAIGEAMGAPGIPVGSVSGPLKEVKAG